MMTMPPADAQQRTVELRVLETSDVHGSFYPFDFNGRRPVRGSLARVDTYLRQLRQQYGDNLLLVDNGDILQGQPPAYYYNFIDTTSVHVAADMLNFMGCVAGNMGNHDVETGRRVFDRWAADCRYPVLGANIIDTTTGEPHFKPYVILERDGVRVAILGMITPAIPVWLSPNLWQGLRFDDMEQTARRWMPVLLDEERADIVIGLFHTGTEAQWLGGKYREHAAVEVAQRVPGFDIILCGHDHMRTDVWTTTSAGDSVLVLNPSNAAHAVADVRIACTVSDGRVTAKHISGQVTSVDDLDVSPDFMARFAGQYAAVDSFVSRRIGTMTQTITTRDAYFGPSAFVDLIHTLQLAITGADISMAAPLSYNAEIRKGDIRVSDMFNLYKYENMLYTMDLTGREVHDYLEYSYGLWINTMHSPDDHVLLMDTRQEGTAGGRTRILNPIFNFDSAAGIVYTVDVTKPAGQKVTILSMADGTPFSPTRHYRVAINSYRGSGGGEHLTKGAGIDPDSLPARILTSTDKDLRYYLMRHIEQHGQVSPKALNQWQLKPAEWAHPASERDRRLLFGDD